MSLRKIILAAAACLTVTSAGFAETPATPQISAKAAYVMDADSGAEIYAKNAEERMYPGGTTTIMTCILGLEKGQNVLDKPITIAKDSLTLDSDVSVLGLYSGDKVTLRNAMTGMMTASGCDVAIDVAETVSPTLADFVSQMNSKAAAIGAVHTHFVNSHGLPDNNQYTTAHDMAKIAAYGMGIPEFRSMVSHKTFNMPYMDSGTKTCESTNDFLSSGFQGANGVKTGYTNMGGPCLIASATRDGRTLVAAIMNSEDRFGDAKTLLSYGFQHQGQPSKDDENVYVVRDAPAGQTLTQIAQSQQKAAELETQKKTTSEATI
ncbi:MAG: D-alanyl-D-alanine carboxypeptidase [Megasphaera sp.]|jgi:D-alanyl-D-alanine carboxypeptidase (penicillin-binding protein 5/6)|nr:D-alanyl-D-alanine carboxypeptidase [Megasphaera sp.]MCH4217739.1 D-alanyl-D-alanine carboxypeptidase [Megasphaera sp.]